MFLFQNIMFYGDGWAVVWPASGMMVAFLLMTRRRYWPWLLLGFLIFQVGDDLQDSSPVWQILVDAGCNLCEIIVVACILPPFRSLAEWLREPRLILRFTLFGVMLAPAATGILTALYYHFAKGRSFAISALRWSVADSLGMVLWVPLILVLFSRETYGLFRRRSLFSTLGFLIAIALLSWLVFRQSQFAVAFVLMPMLLLVALRMRFSGSVLAVNVLTVIATSLTLQGYGQFASIQVSEQTYQVLVLQVYLLLAMLTSFPISLVLLEREEYALKLQSAYQQMEVLATQDSLTGLFNRRHFDSTLEQEWRRAKRERQPIAVLMADVDYFKKFNDRYGHLAGDDTLRAIAELIRSVPERSGDLVARYGGEEFVILLPGIDLQQSVQVADAIRLRVVEYNFAHEGSPFERVTVSIGCCSVVPSEGLLPSLVVQGSDQALYEAKRKGRNRVEMHSFVEVSQIKLF